MVVITTLYEFSSFITGRPDHRADHAHRADDRRNLCPAHGGGSLCIRMPGHATPALRSVDGKAS